MAVFVLGDFVVELVYKRVVVGEMLDRLGPENVMVQAAKDRAVCVANGFGVQLAFRKNLFALLTDPIHSNLFDDDVRRGIEKYVPWTRRVKEVKTDRAGNTVDLIPYILRAKDSLVLKPGGEYGGKGVVLGWEASHEEWESALKYAIANSYIVQERVAVGSELYPSMMESKLIFSERYFDLDPYVWNGCRNRRLRRSIVARTIAECFSRRRLRHSNVYPPLEGSKSPPLFFAFRAKKQQQKPEPSRLTWYGYWCATLES